MKRHSYIIKGHSNNDIEEQAINTYVDYYLYFLRSIAGGVWETDELSKLETPNSQRLKNIIESHNVDYALIIFVGHGATQDDNQLFKLNENEAIKAGQFVLNVPRQMIILESCRSNIQNIPDIPVIDLSDQLPKFENGGIVRAKINRDKAKELFFGKLNSCDKGLVVCFACSVGEQASNFLFTYGLLTISWNWHLDPGYHLQTLNINEIMKSLIKEIPKLSQREVGKIQTPEKIGEANFPFCISKF